MFLIRISLIIFYSLFCLNNVFSQKVYAVDYSSQADVKVYVTKYASQADLLVYKVDFAFLAKDNNGKWFFVKYASQADKKIFYTDYVSQSDLKIFFVKNNSKSKWMKNEKKHLFY